MTYQLSKSMERELTKEEKKKILQYWKENSQEVALDIAKKFEYEVNTPITIICVTKLIMEEALKK